MFEYFFNENILCMQVNWFNEGCQPSYRTTCSATLSMLYPSPPGRQAAHCTQRKLAWQEIPQHCCDEAAPARQPNASTASDHQATDWLPLTLSPSSSSSSYAWPLEAATLSLSPPLGLSHNARWHFHSCRFSYYIWLSLNDKCGR